jgi:N-acetylglutamate synthase-like GNAT family acetyltransferase
MKRAGVTVREATMHDERGIQQLQGNWAKENITHGFRPASLAAVRKSLDEWCYVAETGNQIIGFVHARIACLSVSTSLVSRG